jgi:cytoskeletal protein CcmA (bactofilin family)
MPPGDVSAVIGKSVQIKGELQGNEDLLIDGQVDGTITLHESRLTIGPNARVKANVTARDIVVMGMLQGDLHASGRIELRAGSQVVGDLRAGRLSVEENASYSGKVDLLQSGKDEARGAGASAPGAAATAPVSPAAGHSPSTKPLF